jgi:hypothetical protein
MVKGVHKNSIKVAICASIQDRAAISNVEVELRIVPADAVEAEARCCSGNSWHQLCNLELGVRQLLSQPERHRGAAQANHENALQAAACGPLHLVSLQERWHSLTRDAAPATELYADGRHGMRLRDEDGTRKHGTNIAKLHMGSISLALRNVTQRSLLSGLRARAIGITPQALHDALRVVVQPPPWLAWHGRVILVYEHEHALAIAVLYHHCSHMELRINAIKNNLVAIRILDCG